MKYDMMIAGVGGQGILSIAFVVDNSAMKQGLHFKQSEVHGMAQRGGAVSSHLRISDRPIFSDLVAKGGADLILSVEPMEALRYREYLALNGTVATSTHPTINIPDYPEREALIEALLEVPNLILLNADKVAREAGSARASNMVMVGAVAHLLPFKLEVMEEFVRVMFEKKGEKLIQVNLDAFRFGAANALYYRQHVAAGEDPRAVLARMETLESKSLL
jgi:indolepyruvate ferredoxin oxidoreductase beta subunit